MPCGSAVIGLVFDFGLMIRGRGVPDQFDRQVSFLFIRAEEDRGVSVGVAALVIVGDGDLLEVPRFTAIAGAE